MKYSSFVFFLVLITSCCKDNDAEFKKNCPYELAFGGHYLRIPITISPHQSIYNVGDTVQISTVFSDSIYDLGTQQTFKIENFPFKPLSLLYRISNNESHDSGYDINELNVEDTYEPFNFNSTGFASGYRAKSIYADGTYSFESELILKEPGRYVLVFSDNYQDNVASGIEGLNAEANAITFEGQCPTLGYYLCSMIDSGDTHLDDYEEELIYLDEEVYNDKLGSVRNSIKALGSGGIGVEFSGYFGFEVVE